MAKQNKRRRQLRRAFGTIHYGHIPEGMATLRDFAEALVARLSSDSTYTAGAFALERGSETDREHIQFYIECDRKRFSTMKDDFGVNTEYVFDVVRDAEGSWAYCTGTGSHADKDAVARWTIGGEPKLYGTVKQASLKMMVDLVIDGASMTELIKNHPYEWCLHRSRLIPFANDWLKLTDTAFIDEMEKALQQKAEEDE